MQTRKDWCAILVLSRHRDERIQIGSDISITVVAIRGDKVRLGIDAPTDISVHRQEVFDAIQRETAKGEAAKSPRSISPAVPPSPAGLSKSPSPGPKTPVLAAESAKRLRGLIGSSVDFENLPPQAAADMWRLAQLYMSEHQLE